MKRKNVILIVIGLIALLAVFTNPKQVRHKEVIKAKINTHMQKAMSEEMSKTDDGWEKAGQALGLMLGGLVVDGIIANVVTTSNYVLFSTSNVSWQGESHVIGVGVFGNVFVTKKLDEALERGLFEK